MTAQWMSDAVVRLAEQGFYYGSRVLSRDFLDFMDSWIAEADRSGVFLTAGIGRSDRRHESTAIRGDRIHWLEPQGQHEASRAAWAVIEALRHTLNRELFAGLVDFEGHLAIYPPGGFYKKHVDTFRDDDARSITLIWYLNQSWLPEHGGELRVYHDSSNVRDYAPMPGSVVLFDARRFPHEVLSAKAERRSLTGWYRVRTGRLP
jgi:SM-20-related protein